MHLCGSQVPAICMIIYKQYGESYLGISAKAARQEPPKPLLKDGTNKRWVLRASTGNAKDTCIPSGISSNSIFHRIWQKMYYFPYLLFIIVSLKGSYYRSIKTGPESKSKIENPK